MSRAVAPAWRMASTKSRTEQEPSVFCDPYFVSPMACSTRTRLPVDVEFFGDHQRQGRTAAGAHFRAVRRDHDLAVGFEAEVDAGLPGGGGRRRIGEEIRARAPKRRRRKRCRGRPRRSTASSSTRPGAAVFLVCFAGEAGDFGDGLRSGQYGGGCRKCRSCLVFGSGEAGAVETLHGLLHPRGAS